MLHATNPPKIYTKLNQMPARVPLLGLSVPQLVNSAKLGVIAASKTPWKKRATPASAKLPIATMPHRVSPIW
jgi:hypothetical protein